MNANSTQKPKVLKESKNKIKVDFDRMSTFKRLRLRVLSASFMTNVLWTIFRFVLLIGISYVILLPFITKISASFMGREDFVDVTVKLIPKYPTLDTYKAILFEAGYFKAFFNTFILSFSCALIQTFICSFIGYGLAKYKFKGSKLIFLLVIVTMVVPHKTLRLSMFMFFRYFDIWGIFGAITGQAEMFRLTNTYWPLLLLSFTGLAFKNGLYIFIMRQFFRGVPDELEESAYIDGYTAFKTFIRIILPISIPMLITIFVLSFSWQWTDNFYTTMFFPSSDVQLMPSIVTIPKSLDIDYAGKTLYESAIKNTAGLLIIAPLVILYLFCQRYLVQGIERSGIVG